MQSSIKKTWNLVEEFKKICEKIVNEANVNEEYSKLKILALQIAMEKEASAKRKSEKAEKVSHGLVTLYEKAMKDNMHPYEVLKSHGYIKNPIEEFMNAQ